jgi:hypothetical protein
MREYEDAPLTIFELDSGIGREAPVVVVVVIIIAGVPATATATATVEV